MRIRQEITCTAVAALLATFVAAAGADLGPAPGWQMQNTHEEFSVKRGSLIEVRNLSGDVRLRTLKDDKLAVFSVLQAPDGAALPVVTVATATNQTVTIDVACDTGPGSLPRADLAVFVPQGCPVSVVTSNGIIKLKGVSAPTTLRSHRGNITFKSAGPIDVRTTHGSITGFLEDRAWQEPLVVRSQDGDVEIGVGKAANGTLELTTAGRITSDFSTRVSHHSGGAGKSATIRLGRAQKKWLGLVRRSAPSVTIQSAIGNLAVMKAFAGIEKDSDD